MKNLLFVFLVFSSNIFAMKIEKSQSCFDSNVDDLKEMLSLLEKTKSVRKKSFSEKKYELDKKHRNQALKISLLLEKCVTPGENIDCLLPEIAAEKCKLVQLENAIVDLDNEIRENIGKYRFFKKVLSKQIELSQKKKPRQSFLSIFSLNGKRWI